MENLTGCIDAGKTIRMKDSQTNFRLDYELKKQTEAVCFALGEQRSEFIRKAIKDRIEKKKSENSTVRTILEAISNTENQRVISE